MHPHRSVPWPGGVARPDTSGFRDQRLLLLELVVDPPAGGEPVAALAARLERPPAAIAAAAAALTQAGLAAATPRGIQASNAALAFEALWPACL